MWADFRARADMPITAGSCGRPSTRHAGVGEGNQTEPAQCGERLRLSRALVLNNDIWGRNWRRAHKTWIAFVQTAEVDLIPALCFVDVGSDDNELFALLGAVFIPVRH